jgi:hypothetical protein
MAIPSNAILRVVLSLLLPDSAIAQNVFYTLFENTGGSDDDEDVLTDLSTWMDDLYTAMTAVIDSDVTLTGFKAYIYDSIDEDWDEIGVEFPTVSFGAANDMMPNGIAALVHAPTVNPDVTGGKYFPGGTDASTVENDWTGGAVSNWLAGAVIWVDPFVGAETGSDFIPGVWSTTKEQFFAFTTSAALNAQVAYQRRRKPGVGI